jgi:phosphate/sulfate permease
VNLLDSLHWLSSGLTGLFRGLHNRYVRWRTVSDMLLAWLITVPVAGGISWLAYLVLR